MLEKLHVKRLRPPWRIVFLGTDHFALPVLKALHDNLISGGKTTPSVVGTLDVVTKPHKCLVSKFAENQEKLRLHRWPDVDIQPGQFDVGIVASFGQLLPRKFINLFPYGILNVHPSLLPRWRGCAPLVYTILSGEKTTGVTIQQIQPKRFDIGPIVNQQTFDVPPGSTSMSLSKLLSQEGAKLMLETLEDLLHLEGIEVDQDDRLATYAYKIKSGDPRLYINWANESCRQIDRKFRAFSEIHDIMSYFGTQRVRLRNAVPMADLWMYTLKDRHLASQPGSAVYIKKFDCLCIQCKDGLVGVRDVVVKKPMSAKAFYNGYLSKPHWKYIPFTNQPNELYNTTPTKVSRKKALLSAQKCWQLQLLRMATTPD